MKVKIVVGMLIAVGTVVATAVQHTTHGFERDGVNYAPPKKPAVNPEVLAEREASKASELEESRRYHGLIIQPDTDERVEDDVPVVVEG